MSDNHDKSERPITGRLRSLQHHPAVFWTMAGLVVFGFLWGLWSYAQTKPTRAISYDWRVERIVEARDAAMLGTAFELANLGNADIYLNHLRVWNSGNLDILDEHFLLPLKISYPSETFIIEVRHFNVPIENMIGGVEHSFKFDKLFAGGGLLITFVSLGRSDTRVVEGQIYGVGGTRPPDNRSPDLLFGINKMFVWIIMFFVLAGGLLLVFWRQGIDGKIFWSFAVSYFVTFGFSLAWIIVRELFLAPPF